MVQKQRRRHSNTAFAELSIVGSGSAGLKEIEQQQKSKRLERLPKTVSAHILF
jgi:hypothetical protein